MKLWRAARRMVRSAKDRPARAVLAGAALLGAAELSYVVLAPAALEARLGELGRARGVEVAIDRLRSWYPGDIDIQGVRLEGSSCAARFARVEGHFGAFSWLGGHGRLEDAAIEGIMLECEGGGRPGIGFVAEDALLSLSDVFEEDDRIRVGAAHLRLRGATLTLDETPVLRGLKGHVAATHGPDDTQALGGLSFDARLGSERARAPIPSRAAARIGPLDEEGTFEAKIEWRDGRLAPDSHLVFELPAVEHDDLRGRRTALPEGLSLSLRVEVGRPVWRLSLPRYERTVGGRRAVLDDVECTLATSDIVDPLSGGAKLRGTVSRGRLHTGVAWIDGTFEVAGEARPGPGRSMVELASARLTFGDLHVGGTGREAPSGPTHGEVTLEEAVFQGASSGIQLQGRLEASGEDARAVLKLASAEEGPSWVTEKFDGYPFSLSSRIRYDAGGLMLRGLKLERGAMTLRGWLKLLDDGRYGALRLDFGLLSMGMKLEGNETELVPSPPPDWLEQTRVRCFAPQDGPCHIASATAP